MGRGWQGCQGHISKENFGVPLASLPWTQQQTLGLVSALCCNKMRISLSSKPWVHLFSLIDCAVGATFPGVLYWNFLYLSSLSAGGGTEMS